MTFFAHRSGLPWRPPISSAVARTGAVTLVLFACGCSSNPGSHWGQIWQAAAAITEPARTVAREDVAAIPYATMGIRAGGGDEFPLILAQSNSETLLWTSGARIVLVTAGGRIVQTAGLERNLDKSYFVPQDWLPRRDGASQADFTTRRYVDLADLNAYSVTVSCIVTFREDENIEILGTNIPTRRVDEMCDVPELDWSFVNQFWLSQTSGFVWQSVQYVHPEFEPVGTRVFRPPA